MPTCNTMVHVDLLNLVQRAVCVYTYTHGFALDICLRAQKIYTVLLAESRSWTIKPLAFGKLYPVQLSYISIYRGSGLLPSDLYLIVEQ